MSQKYSIGQVAQRLNISTRTVRYYDEKDLVKPDCVKENGYRYYSDEQIFQLQEILYLKELGFSLKQIRSLLQDQDGEKSLKLLLSQQYRDNKAEIERLQQQQDKIRHLQKFNGLKIDNLLDITQTMNKANELRSFRRKMLGWGLGLTIIEVFGIVWIWHLFKIHRFSMIPWTIGFLVLVIFGLSLWLVHYYYEKVAYVCPNCGERFVPTFWAFNFSAHTPRFRKLRCPKCGKKAYCLEVARE
ncbi:MerR family transcriptional regulator [uncultured Lactobacillus sp.]|uniref:MerR family transcriptional regulator n=1 Tax=uncultured Lactobacillus sp. TaxID=153152 RepID=UPI002634B2F4|nr:MerR family transcriptional regulator [uncultured Lactobacillus sp.]